MVLCKYGYDKFFNPYLLKCMKDGDNNKVIEILQEYSQSEVPLCRLKDNLQATLLHYAVKYGNEEIVKYLLNSDFEVDARDCHGTSPVMIAVNKEHVNTFDILLKSNANINLMNWDGKSALQMIFDLKDWWFWMLKKLFENATWQKITEFMTPNELAENVEKFGNTSHFATLLGSTELMKVLLDRGKLTVESYNDTETLLHKAVRMRNLDLVKLHVDYGADVDAMDCHKRTPLYYVYCITNNSYKYADAVKILKVLMCRTTFPTKCTDDGRMQLCYTLKSGIIEAIEVLIQSNFDFNVKDERGRTGLQYLTKNWNVNFHMAAQHESLVVLKFFIDNGADINVTNSDGETALHVAAKRKSFVVLKFLLENRADVNVMNNKGETALYLAFKKFQDLSDKHCVNLLLRYGADLQTYVTKESDHDFCTIFDLVLSRSRKFIQSESNDYSLKELLATVEPVIARLAYNEMFGVKTTDLTRSKINMQLSWTEYYDKCQYQLRQMKNTVVYGNITLFRLLIENEKKMIAYVRNKELIYELNKIFEKFGKCSPYLGLVYSRVSKVILLAKLKEKAITAICQVAGSKSNAYYTVADYISDYLNVPDMENLCFAMFDVKV